MKTIDASRHAAILTAIVCGIAAAGLAAPEKILCDGDYSGHLQGVDTDGTNIYWSFTTAIVKTDLTGKRLVERAAPSHQGDLCFRDGIVYVAVNRGKFNTANRAKSQVTSYRADTLEPIKTWLLPDMPHGAGGITYSGSNFYVVGGLPITHECNYVYEYTPDFQLVKRHVLETGFTWMGIQTAACIDGRFLFGIYGCSGNSRGILDCPLDLSSFIRRTGPGNTGLLKLDGAFYAGGTSLVKGTDAVKGKRRYTGLIRREPGLLDPSTVYKVSRTGKGEIRLFFEGRDATGWKDGGYEMQPDGNRPLNAADELFVPRAKAATTKILPALGIGGGRPFLPRDLVRAVRRTAVRNEVFSVHMPGTPATLKDDPALAAAVDGMVSEAEKLGVRVTGR